MSRTGIAYDAMQCAVLAWRIVLHGLRYWLSVCCSALSGTEIAYGGHVTAAQMVAQVLSPYPRAPIPLPVCSYPPNRMLLSPYPYAPIPTRMLQPPYPYAAMRCSVRG
eukprot:3937916-Rhodomonas_salina.2